MKYLKTFDKLYESGIPGYQIQELKAAVKEIISNGWYQPNIKVSKKSESDEQETRSFNVVVSANQSKFGKVVEVSFALDYPVGYDEINPEFKQGTLPLEIAGVISDLMNGETTLYGFNFFDNKILGKKDGRTLEVEDVLPKFTELVSQLDSEPDKISYETTPIMFWFLVK